MHPAHATAAFSDIVQTLQDYFDGLYYSDAEKLAGIFHTKANYACATEAPLLYLRMDEYLPIVAKRPSPASRGEPRRDSIEAIEFAGPYTAFAHVKCAIGPKYFTDFLTLIRTDGKWQIISKIFHYDILPETAEA
ncbi:nuclear transport factor 2 family protein [Tepidicaulis sp.]|uniref:nuclear transport factor 2 family protein n=1 Tax=Tepidicaulis sp. TaxID=1920809 RepID=UPI003B5AEF89